MFQLKTNNSFILFDRPAVMGILNVTPDSFSDGGRYNIMDSALQHCEQMLSEGADIIDIGGCSTRPNNAIATEQEELERVIPILKAIRKAFPTVLVSIDTFRKNVAEVKAPAKKKAAKKASHTKAPAQKSQAKKAVGSKKTASVQKAAVSKATAKQTAAKRNPMKKGK